jgi:hypothetical protein
MVPATTDKNETQGINTSKIWLENHTNHPFYQNFGFTNIGISFKTFESL